MQDFTRGFNQKRPYNGFMRSRGYPNNKYDEIQSLANTTRTEKNEVTVDNRHNAIKFPTGQAVICSVAAARKRNMRK